MDNDDSEDFHILDLIKRSQYVQNNILHEDNASSLIRTVALTNDFLDFKQKTKWINVIPPVWDSDIQDGYVQNIVDDFFLAATKNLDKPVQDKILPRDTLNGTNINEKTGEDNSAIDVENENIGAVVKTVADAKELIPTTTTTVTSLKQPKKKKKILKASSIDFANKSSKKKDGCILTPTRKPQARLCSERHPHTAFQPYTILEISQQSNNKVSKKTNRRREFYIRPIDFTEMHPEWKLEMAIDHDFMLNNAKGNAGGGKNRTLFPRRVPNLDHVPNLIHDKKTIKTNHEDSSHINIPELSFDLNKEKLLHFKQIAEKVFDNGVKQTPHTSSVDRKWSDIFKKENKKKILKYSPINLSSYCNDDKITDGNSTKRIIIEHHTKNENKVTTERKFNIHHLPIISIRGDCRIQKLHKIIIAPTNGEQTHESVAKANGINQQANTLSNENVKYFQFIYKSQCEEEKLERKLSMGSDTIATTSITKNNQICDEKKKVFENNKIFNNDNNLENSMANGKTFEEFINQFSDKVRTEKDIKTSGVDIAVTDSDVAAVAGCGGGAGVNVGNEGNLLQQVNSNGRIRKFETMANITNEEYRDLVAELMANVECSDDDDDRGADAIADGLNRAGGNKYLAPFNLNARDDNIKDDTESVDKKIIKDSEQDDKQSEYCDDTFEKPNSLTHLSKSNENKISNESPSVNSSIMDFDMSGSIIAKSDISMSLTDDEKLSSRFTAQINNNNNNNKIKITKSDEVINIYDISKTENQFNDDESKLMLDTGVGHQNYEITLPVDMLNSCAVTRNTSKSHVNKNDNKLQMCDRGQLKYEHQYQNKPIQQQQKEHEQQLKLENINFLENDKVIKAANGNNSNNNNNNNVIVFQPNNNNEKFNNRLSINDNGWVDKKHQQDQQQHKEQENAFRDFIAATTTTAVNENINRVIIQSNSRQEDCKEKNHIYTGGSNSRTVNFVYKNLYESSDNNNNNNNNIKTETVVTDGKVCTVDGYINSVSGNNKHCNSKSILNVNDGNISCRNLLDVTELRNTLHSVGMKLIDLQQRRLKGNVIKHLDNIYDDIKSQNDEYNMVERREQQQQQQQQQQQKQHEQHILQHNNGATIMGINVVSCNKGNWQSQHVPSVSSMMVGEVTNEVDKRQFINMTANHHLTKTNCCTESTKCENYIMVEHENMVVGGCGGDSGNCGVKGLCFDKSIPENYRFKHIEMMPAPTPAPTPQTLFFESPQYVAGDNIRQQQQHPVLSQQQCIVDNSNTITSLKNNKTDGINNNNNNNNKQDVVNPNQCQKMFFSSSQSQCEFNVVKNSYLSPHPTSPSSQMAFCCSNNNCSNRIRNYHPNSCSNCVHHSHATNKCNCFMCYQTKVLTPVERTTTETQTIESQLPQETLIESSSDYKQIENPFTKYQRPLLPRRQVEKPMRYNHKEFQRLVLESSPKMGKTIKSIIQSSGNHNHSYNKIMEDNRINADKSQKAVQRFLNSIKQKINRTNLRYKESDLLSSDFSSVDDDLLRNTSSSNYSSEDKDYFVRNNKTQRTLVKGKDDNIARNIIMREIQTTSDNNNITKDTSHTTHTITDNNNKVLKVECGHKEKISTQRILSRYPLEWPYIDTSSDFQNNSVYSTSSIEFQIAKLKLVSGEVGDNNNEFDVTPHISPVTSSCASLLSSIDDNNLCPKTVRTIVENNSLSDGEILSQGEIHSNGSGF